VREWATTKRALTWGDGRGHILLPLQDSLYGSGSCCIHQGEKHVGGLERPHISVVVVEDGPKVPVIVVNTKHRDQRRKTLEVLQDIDIEKAPVKIHPINVVHIQHGAYERKESEFICLFVCLLEVVS